MLRLRFVYYVLCYYYLFRPVASCRFQLASTYIISIIYCLVCHLYASYHYLGICSILYRWVRYRYIILYTLHIIDIRSIGRWMAARKRNISVFDCRRPRPQVQRFLSNVCDAFCFVCALLHTAGFRSSNLRGHSVGETHHLFGSFVTTVFRACATNLLMRLNNIRVILYSNYLLTHLSSRYTYLTEVMVIL